MKKYLIYSDGYDFAFRGLSRLHPFNGDKFSKAWEIVRAEIKDKNAFDWIDPGVSVSDESLLKIHTIRYLDSLHSSGTIAKIIEIWPVRFIPNFLLQARLIAPVKLACSGTIQATQAALSDNAFAMNFGGGYHHAFSDHGEGFCFFADAVLSIQECRESGLLNINDKILMIDLDAHRGNGFEALTNDDAAIQNFDMYNFQVYPGLHTGDPDEYPYMIPLKAGMKDEVYLDILETELENFLAQHDDAKLVFYNAGNDILSTDSLGGLSISFAGVIKRDQFVLQQLANRKLPTVVMTSGGYSKQSHLLIAELAKTAIAVNH